jgi:hypothetical protein
MVVEGSEDLNSNLKLSPFDPVAKRRSCVELVPKFATERVPARCEHDALRIGEAGRREVAHHDGGGGALFG